MQLKNIKTIYLIAFCFLALSLSSCFNVLSENEVITDEHTPRLVVNGLITSQPGPYYVQLSLTSVPSALAVDYTPITNATVTISDTQGNVDVLKPFDDEYPNLYDGDNLNRTWADLGYYQTTTNLQGTPGQTYTLTIVYDGQTYKATATMPLNAPELALKHEDNYKLPFIYFDEPQDQENYYLFYYSSFTNGSAWPFHSRYEYESIPNNLRSTFYSLNLAYDDTYLPSKVERLDIYEGNNRQLFAEPSPFDPDSSVVEMHSVTREVYDLYQAIKKQQENDGGAFDGPPADLPTNLSNGALGFFRASAISRKTIPFTR